MDLLSEAAALRDEGAAEILNLLRAQPASPSPPPSEDDERSSSFNELPDPSYEDSSTNQGWSRAEDDLLRRISSSKSLSMGGGRGRAQTLPLDSNLPVWQELAEQFEGRTPAQCMLRWRTVLNTENVKGPWCPNEDAQLMELVSQYGGKHWAHIASMLPGRTGKQCRERWCNNLDPTLKKGAWTPDEDQIILKMHAKLGTRWAEIAKCLPGRSDNSVKNRWYSTCSRLLRQQQLEAMGGAGGEAMGGGAGEASSSGATSAKQEPRATAELAEPLSRPRARGGRKEPASSEGGGEEAGGSGRVSPSPAQRVSPPNHVVFPSPLKAPRSAGGVASGSSSAPRRAATVSPSPRSRKRSKSDLKTGSTPPHLATPTSPATEERVILLADKPKTLHTVERPGPIAEGAAQGADDGAALKLVRPASYHPLTASYHPHRLRAQAGTPVAL